MRAMDIAATGMMAQQTNVEVIANNIANQNTTGFKEQRPEFQDLLYQTERRGGANSSDNNTIVPVGVQIGIGVQTAAVYRINTQGNLAQTGNPLDLAIQGNGYFQVLQPDGTIAYTRDGSFQLSPTGEIVTADGYVVEPGITIPQNTTSISVNSSGQVQAQVAGQTNPQTVGQLQLANFANPDGLNAIGNNLYLQTQASGQPVTGDPGTTAFGTVNQGMLETSNVDIVSEITNLITAQRAYEMNSKVIQSSDQMMQTLNQIQ
ncbi:MAG TPA: flagellar basal-body rod protein FlgG [Stellaceae bacterium]|jgi:flagellar basal-body rod protein FlgG|nr:flagellar basal-body rod protein FlgG [Stellaceae bacterium]